MSYKFNPFTGTFDETGSSQLPDPVMEFKGLFDPATATFTDASGNSGDVWQSTAAGSYDAGSGSITYAIGDWAVHNGSVFQKSLNSMGVNTTLSNLTSLTAVNQNLFFNTGSTATLSTSFYGGAVTKDLFVQTGQNDTFASGNLWLVSGATEDSAVSGNVHIQSGDADINNGTTASGTVFITSGVSGVSSGDIDISVGTGSPQGKIRLKPTASATVVGQVWEATDTNGAGNWSNILHDNTNTASIDYDGRSLRDPSGNVIASWNSGQYITFYPNGGVPRILEFWDGNFSNTVNITAPTNVLLDYTLTLPQTASGSANSVVLEDGGGTLSFSTNLKDTSGVQSVLYSSRELTDSTGSEVALNWDTRILSDINSDPAINFSSATDIVASKNIDFDANGTLNIGSSTNNANVLWTRNVESNSYLGLYADLNHVELGSNAEEVKIITWNGVVAPTLKLQDSNNFDVGIKSPDVLSASYTLTLPADDGAPSQVMSTNGSGALSFIGTLADASNVQSVLFQTRELTDSTGTEVTLNWDTRKLFDTSSTEVLDFSGTNDTIISKNLRFDVASNTLILQNDTFLKGRNAAGTLDIDIVKINSFDAVEISNGSSSNSIYIDEANNYIGLFSAPGGVTEIYADRVDFGSNGGGQPAKIRLLDQGSNYVELKTPNTVTTSYSLTLPIDDGTTGQVLTTDGSGILSWSTPAGAGANTSLTNISSVNLGDNLFTTKASSLQIGHNLGGQNVTIFSQNNTGASAGDVQLISGSASGGTGTGGTLYLEAGGASATGNAAGTAYLKTANSILVNNVTTGSIFVETGLASGTGSNSGAITIRSQSANNNSGDITLQTGTATSGTRGSITLNALTANLTVNKITVPTTVTAGGTTGNQTINKVSGTVNFAAAATSLVVTNSEVSANSIVLCTIRTNDATMTSVQAVPAAGSFTLYANAAATAETSVGFLVING